MSTNRNAMRDYIRAHAMAEDAPDVLELDSQNLIWLLDHSEIGVPEENRFFVTTDADDLEWEAIRIRARVFDPQVKAKGLHLGNKNKAYTGAMDFSHTTPEWERVLGRGILGLKQDLEARLNAATDPKKARFYRACLGVYEACLRFMARAADKAEEAGKAEMASGLRALCTRAPENLFEGMQTMLAYYMFQHSYDGSYLRTLGRLDSLFWDWYVKEDPTVAKKLVYDFMEEIDRLNAPSNIPFAIGGTDREGKVTVNALSYLLLEAYQNTPSINTKLHLLCTAETPEEIIADAFRGAKSGKNSVVFMADDKIKESLIRLGADPWDAANYHVVGCYECGAENELTCSCNARVNIPKAVEYALTGGTDMLTGDLVGLPNGGDFPDFDAFMAEYTRQLLHLADCAMEVTDIYEKNYNKIHSAPVFSATYQSALDRGADLYADYAAKYNSSSLNAIGLATATDSLAAIRKLVFEDGIMTLSELRELLRADWAGKEPLRLAIRNRYPKYGMGDKKTDLLAKRTIEALSGRINGRPNVKGGHWRLGTFSINWRWEFGEQTAASANGRLSGETLSQNTSASFGADKEGATAHLISAAVFDSVHTPNGSVVDIDLHASAVQGENGIQTLIATLKTYFDMGGFSVHYNILDTETLQKAKKNPADYPNLQVRLCGWNVLFSTLSDAEKDEFIARSAR